VALRTVSLWLSLPLLQRVEAFLSLLSTHQQQLAAAAAADARYALSSCLKACQLCFPSAHLASMENDH
jgi:hypothetical protein